MRTLRNTALATLIGVTASLNATAGDWPVWRGEKGDGISNESKWNPKAITKLTVKWNADLGVGYSAISVKNGRVYTMGNTGKSDTVYCFDEASGKVLWKHAYPCKLSSSFKGPRATPLVIGDAVYTLGREGHAFCLNAEKGTVIWSKNLIADFGAKNLTWGISASPLVVDKAIIYNAGEHGIALDIKTGKKLWGIGGVGGYAVPVKYNNTILVFAREAAIGVDVNSGKKLWSYPWKTKHLINAADPVVVGNKALFTSGYGKGAFMLDLSGGNVRKVWEGDTIKAHFSTPVYLKGHIFGVDGQTGRGRVICMDLNGDIKWSEKTGFASLMAADNKLIILTEKGTLLIAEASSSGFNKIAEVKTGLGKTCWTQPILSNGTIYCRNDKGKLLAIDVSK